MGNAQLAEIYHRMKPEDQRLLFKRFHKQYYETHGHDAPSHQLTRGIVQQMFPGLPSVDAVTIAKARAELLAAERLKELCKQLGLAVPTQLQEYPLSGHPHATISLIFMSTHKATAARCLSHHQATYGLPPSAWPL